MLKQNKLHNCTEKLNIENVLSLSQQINLNIEIYGLIIILSNVPGHSFIRKWMLLSNPQDRGGDESEPVGVVIFDDFFPLGCKIMDGL